jgi:hypothetical protein
VIEMECKANTMLFGRRGLQNWNSRRFVAS